MSDDSVISPCQHDGFAKLTKAAWQQNKAEIQYVNAQVGVAGGRDGDRKAESRSSLRVSPPADNARGLGGMHIMARLVSPDVPIRSRVWLRLKCSAAPSLCCSAAGQDSSGLPVPLRRNRSAAGLGQGTRQLTLRGTLQAPDQRHGLASGA